jgi:hypothetical protein
MATQSQADVAAADSGSPYEMRLALVLNGVSRSRCGWGA